jgi:hypothetical protein
VIQDQNVDEAERFAQAQLPRSSTNLGFLSVAHRVSNDLRAERDAFIADENAL